MAVRSPSLARVSHKGREDIRPDHRRWNVNQQILTPFIPDETSETDNKKDKKKYKRFIPSKMAQIIIISIVIMVISLPIFFCVMLEANPTTMIPEYSIWPLPQKIKTKYKLLSISPENFELLVKPSSPSCEIVNLAIKRYEYLMFGQECKKWSSFNEFLSSNQESSPWKGKGGQQKGDQVTRVTLDYSICEDIPREDMKEAYSLVISEDNDKNVLKAETVWGILRGLETLSQMISRPNDSSSFQILEAKIQDFPRYRYRGLLIDTARHFIPIKVIKQNLDAMVYNKLNVFHWHIVDDHSFPYVSQSFPHLHASGAYNPKTHTFSPSEVKDIINYARIRGIRVIVEFDSPGHTLSWASAVKGFLTTCYPTDPATGTVDTSTPVNTNFGPVDPSKESNYQFLETFLKEVKSVFPDNVIHLGGDEVNFDCWKSNPDITKFMQENAIESYESLQSYYMKRVMDIVSKLNASSMVWEEVFTHGTKMSSKDIVHVWLGWTKPEWMETLKNVTGSGIRAILSAPWYLNHQKYGIDWRELYETDPSFEGTETQENLLIGASICMWTEYVNANEITPKTWARASAVAERFWSSKDVNSAEKAAPRLRRMSCLMLSRGVKNNAVDGPDFCPCDYTIE